MLGFVFLGRADVVIEQFGDGEVEGLGDLLDGGEREVALGTLGDADGGGQYLDYEVGLHYILR